MKKIKEIGINTSMKKLGHLVWFYEGALTFCTILKEMRLVNKFVQVKSRLLDTGCFY